MNKKQRERLYVAQAMIDGRITISDGALSLDLSERQVKRIKAGVKKHGNTFVIH